MIQKYKIITTGSTVVVQQENGGPWIHESVMDKGDNNHNDCSYKVQVTKMGQLITKNRKQVAAIYIGSNKYQISRLKSIIVNECNMMYRTE